MYSDWFYIWDSTVLSLYDNMDLDKFVIEISNHRELYDPSNKHYKDVEMKDNIFLEISTMFILTGEWTISRILFQFLLV